jgi:hypothetical protein
MKATKERQSPLLASALGLLVQHSAAYVVADKLARSYPFLDMNYMPIGSTADEK